MDRLKAIRSFVEVAQTASFTQAAENLDLSRLQVSRHVQEVEAWLKQRLLHRTTRKVSLTLPGEEALSHCLKILNETNAMVSKAEHQGGSLSGSIRIAAPIGLAQNLLFDVVDDFVQQHPAVQVDILGSDSFAQLVEERIDVALRFTNQPDDNLIARRLMSLETVTCASKQYIEKNGQPLDPNQLRQHNCLVHLSRAQWDYKKGDQTHKVNVDGNIKANDLGVLIKAAVRGRGIVRLPCDLANPLITAKKLEALFTDYEFSKTSIWAVYLSRSHQLTVVRQFIDHLAASWDQDITLGQAHND